MRIVSLLALVGVLVACNRDEPVENPSTLPEAASADAINGQAVYVQHCLLCHQHDGGGVPNIQPALLGNAVASGDADRLIEVVLRGIGGQAPALPASGNFAMVMPGATQLTDQQIADLLTYIRQAFVDSRAISPEQVAAVRQRLE